jgi:segregation and condensation protein A
MSEQHSELEAPEQAIDPLATVLGESITELPKDLYIPPDALEVILEAFHGPLDLLLYLIKKQNLDILDIPIARITDQYMEYIELIEGIRFELAAEYLLMAAMLAEIKSRMLLPRTVNEEGEEDDPRAELVRRLQEYEQFKLAAEQLNELPRQQRDTTQAEVAIPPLDIARPLPDVMLNELVAAVQDVLRRVDLTTHHRVQMEPLSIRERMSEVLAQLTETEFLEFHQLFDIKEGRMGVIVSFIAVLELLKGSLINIVQSSVLGPLHVQRVG